MARTSTPDSPPRRRGRARQPDGFGAPRPAVTVRAGHYRLPPDVATRVRAGHPWVFRDAFGGRAITEPTGAMVTMFTGNHEFVARGYVDHEHAIAVRVVTRDPGQRISPGAGAVAARFARAVELRRSLFGGADPDAMRLFSGESEGLPGVTVDRYGEFVLAQWLSSGALPWRDELYDAIEAVVAPRGLYEQRRFRPLAGQGPPEPAVRARGVEAPVELVIDEAGCKLAVDLTAPLGVGIFPDMRLGRAAVAARAADRRVCNLFSYTGAFSVRAARAGAREIVAVDLAAKANARSRRNLELSGMAPTAVDHVTGDVLKTLERFAARGRRFDLVVCDPPTFSHGPQGALALGKDLAAVGRAVVSVLDPGGLLVFATNSTRISSADVDRALAEGAAQERADLRIIERIGLPPDFPVAPGFPEGNYLKCVFAVRA